ncbi:MAG: acyl-CoA thioesterase [Myxococcales bacterium]|nr:acyl-CoA thioesterase [Myxococcales bacterium]MCB9644443.1 acyl-CoA thioesterase [Myxococcales bacterium]
MLLYTVRLVSHFLWYARKPRLEPFEEISQDYRAFPWICDNNLHVNNAQYLRLMEYGRVEWIARMDLMRPILRGELNFVAAGTSMLFRREIRLMTSFSMKTRLVGFDAKWLFMQQDFILGDGPTAKIAARGLVRVQPRTKKGAMSVDAFFTLAGYPNLSSPALPEELVHWQSSSEASLEEIRSFGGTRAA